MFNNISWQGYWLSLALISAGYYLVIYLLYYRNDFKIIWHQKLKAANRNSFTSASKFQIKEEPSEAHHQTSLFGDEDEFQLPPKDSIEHIIYTCTGEVTTYLEEANRNKSAKEELLYSLQIILKKYPAIQTSNYKKSLTEVIVTQCKNICSIHLSADDVVRMWIGS